MMSRDEPAQKPAPDAPSADARTKGQPVRIVVVPDPGIAFPEGEADAVDYLLSRNRAGWKLLGAEFGPVRVTRLIPSATRGKMHEIVAGIRKRTSDYRWPAFADYFLIEAKEGASGHALASRLKEWINVRDAFPYVDSECPGVVIPSQTNRYDPNFRNQFYLRPAPEGVGIEEGWTHHSGQSGPGADGSGLALVDMENGFNPDHEDLAAHFQPSGANPRDPITGLNNPKEASHGTAVLGIVCASNNQTGCCGLVPNLSHVVLASTLTIESSAYRELARAAVLTEAVYYLRSWPGSVILIEHQLSGTPAAPDGTPGIPYGTPVELQLQDFGAIRLACDAGCVVVEPAGNGGADLDRDVRPPSPDINQSPSGAIMVAASGLREVPNTGETGFCHIPLHSGEEDATTVGSRIDCFAPGEMIWTCGATLNTSGSGALFRNDEYLASFGNTSAASAIIAGVALCTQGIALDRFGVTLNPVWIRWLLTNPDFSTLSENGLRDRIGVMPDVGKIALALRQMQQLPSHWSSS